MHLFYQPDPVLFLNEDDSRHAVKTLRLGSANEIAVTDGQGNRFRAVITKADARQCGFQIIDRENTPAPLVSIRICLAPTKNLDRIEWFVEKAVELGIDRISFFYGHHSERRVLKRDRLEKIAVAAMKQSLQNWLPTLDELMSFAQLLETVGEGQRFIAHLPEGEAPEHLFRAAKPGETYTVLIGPEGDFSAQELQKAQAAGFQMVSLGQNRLRTETAALAACQILHVRQVQP